MSRTMWMKKLIGGTSNNALNILYKTAGRVATNVKAELDRINASLTEQYLDTDNFTVMQSSLTNSYTAPKTGLYFIFASGTSINPILYLDSNRTVVLAQYPVSGGTMIIPLKEGTTIYLRANCNYGVTGYIEKH